MSIRKEYEKVVKDETGYSATWLPTVIAPVGDVGRITDYQYERLTDLNKFGISYRTIPGSVKAEFDFCSADAVSINAKLAGQAPIPGSGLGQADAGVSVKFSRKNAAVFRLWQCSSTMISDLYSLEKQILALYNKGKWEKDLVVVTESVKADSSTILVSKSSNAQIDLLAKGNLEAGKVNLASVEANFQITKESSIGVKIIASRNLTPLFKASGIKKSRLLEEGAETEVLAPVDYTDFARTKKR